PPGAAPAEARAVARPPSRRRGWGRLFKYRNSRNWWIAYPRRGKEIRESTGLEDREKAEKLLDVKVKQATRPDFIDPAMRRLTFEDLADGFLRSYRLKGRRSLPDAERHVRQLREVFG